MPSYMHAYQSYSSTPIKSTKDTEIEIILETTRRLKRADEMRDTDFPTFVSALQDNRKLWITLAANVADSQNRLPRELRAKIFYLSEFVQAYTRKILTEELSSYPLFDINVAILRGLTSKRNTE
ncbi:MAG: flagellar biosynthesis regulator FlaF [Pelagibaca sp.]